MLFLLVLICPFSWSRQLMLFLPSMYLGYLQAVNKSDKLKVVCPSDF